MTGKNTMSKVVIALVLGGTVAVNGSIAFAQGARSVKTTGSKAYVQYANKSNINNKFKTLLDALVTAGTITSAQETAVLKAYAPANNAKHGNFKDKLKTKLDALVTTGSITSDQETAILNLITTNAVKSSQKQK